MDIYYHQTIACACTPRISSYALQLTDPSLRAARRPELYLWQALFPIIGLGSEDESSRQRVSEQKLSRLVAQLGVMAIS